MADVSHATKVELAAAEARLPERIDRVREELSELRREDVSPVRRRVDRLEIYSVGFALGTLIVAMEILT